MPGIALPLLHGQHHEQGGHGEVHAGGVEGDEVACGCADQAAADPVEVIQQGDGEVIVRGVHPGGGYAAGQQGVGLVCHGKDQVALARPRVLIAGDHAQTVEEMAEVQQEGEQSDLGQTGLAGDQCDGQKLAGAGVDDEAHE